MSEWISVEDRLPESKPEKWSNPVIALCDCGMVYRLSYFNGVDGGCWQRTQSFADNASKKVIKWMEFPE